MSNLQQTTLANQALDLPASERARLALLLFDSVEKEGEGSDFWPSALADELRRRSAELRSGKVRGLTSEEVFGESL